MHGKRTPIWNASFVGTDGTKINIRNIVWVMESYNDTHSTFCSIEKVLPHLPLGGARKMSVKMKPSGDKWYIILLWKGTLAGQTYKTICTEVTKAHGRVWEVWDCVRDLVEEAIQEWNAPAESGFIIVAENFFPEAGIFVVDSLKPV